jgi:hypothetical protein
LTKRAGTAERRRDGHPGGERRQRRRPFHAATYIADGRADDGLSYICIRCTGLRAVTLG